MRNIFSLKSNFLHVFLFIFCFFLSTVNASSSVPLPRWFTSVKSDQVFISDVGVGQTLEQAKEYALSNIAKSMSSHVSVSVESHLVTENNASVVNKTLSHTSISVDDVILSTVRWTHSELIDDMYYVRGNIKLTEWVAINQNRLASYLTDVNAIIGKSRWNLKDYRKSLQVDIQKIESLTSMLAPFAFETSNTRDVIDVLHEKRNDYLRRHCFSVKESRNKITDKYFLPVVKSAVHQSEFSLSDASDCDVISIIAHNDKIAGNKIRTTFLIQIYGYESYQLEVTGYGGSYKTRLISAANNLSLLLEQQGGIFSK
jgi:hypothetical protein